MYWDVSKSLEIYQLVDIDFSLRISRKLKQLQADYVHTLKKQKRFSCSYASL